MIYELRIFIVIIKQRVWLRTIQFVIILLDVIIMTVIMQKITQGASWTIYLCIRFISSTTHVLCTIQFVARGVWVIVLVDCRGRVYGMVHVAQDCGGGVCSLAEPATGLRFSEPCGERAASRVASPAKLKYPRCHDVHHSHREPCQSLAAGHPLYTYIYLKMNYCSNSHFVSHYKKS